ncbi:unnamed protein product [Spirodela intermedia]|uniref:DUF7733 domain-containing protein n=2 Tax=Spirodela intermedia TaxID=51605 RepID=A0A7I8IDW1_SPIIN|nr:unnamed protein product [Spirodela intermedia]CAA6655575.1 unnamed protein product [Spirodela intermedia]CAA7390878.1 unnamed protein product [Spirodela intermedia]
MGGSTSLRQEEEEPRTPTTPQGPSGARKSTRRFPSFQHVNTLAVMIVLSASGLVALEDLAFFVLSLGYIYFLSSFAFPARSREPEPLVFGEENRALALYVLAGGALGLLFPIAFILDGVLGGDKEGIEPAAAHLFLLSSQVFMEGVAFAGAFSLPIRAFVPISYNTRRLFTIADWLRAELRKAEGASPRGSLLRLRAGRSLAAANLIFWSFNLFGFLLPVFLPRALQRYYGKQAKSA